MDEVNRIHPKSNTTKNIAKNDSNTPITQRTSLNNYKTP